MSFLKRKLKFGFYTQKTKQKPGLIMGSANEAQMRMLDKTG